MDKQISIRQALVAILVTVLVTVSLTSTFAFIIGNFVLADIEKTHQNNLENAMEGVEVFSDIIEMYNSLPADQRNYDMYLKLAQIDMYYRNFYVKSGEIDNDNLTYGVANGYIAGIGDMHGEYYTMDDFSALIGQTQGNTVGIGVYVTIDTETECVKILTVMENSPAQKAGMKAGDVVIAIDDVSVTEIGYYEAINRVAGKEGTTVKLKVLRGDQILDLVATREKFETQTVYYHKYSYNEKIGVVRVIEFNDSMPGQFKNAVNSLLADGCEYLVFDMRSNGGGTLSSAVEILDFLLPKGDIVSATDKDGKVLETYKSGESSIDVPMAVLTDGYTASAAELFTCALRDYEKAIVVGTTTYGKGSMQNVIMLPDGSGLRFTTNLYNPPKSPNYDGVGIIPDIEVELDISLENINYFEITDAQDNQLKEACSALGNK